MEGLDNSNLPTNYQTTLNKVGSGIGRALLYDNLASDISEAFFLFYRNLVALFNNKMGG